MIKLSEPAAAALAVIRAGGKLRTERQPDGTRKVVLYNCLGEKRPGYYNEVQIVLDGRGYLHADMVSGNGHYESEWTFQHPESFGDPDHRSYAKSIYKG